MDEATIEPHSINERYNINCFGVEPDSHRRVVRNGSFLPERKDNYRIFNIGRVPILAEAKYGTAAQWFGTLSGATVQPGEEEILNVGRKLFYDTGVYLKNYHDERALVHCSREVLGYPWLVIGGSNGGSKMDINAVSKNLVLFGVSKIPEVGETMSALIGFFWPENEVSVWDQIKNQVADLIDAKTMDIIRGILGGDIRYFKERIESLKHDLENHEDVSGHYMNIAEDLIGFEKKFAFSTEDNSNADAINYYILPLFSTMVSLKMNFYQFGILNSEKIRLSMDQVQRLKEYSKRLIEGPNAAIEHISGVLDERINHELNNCDPDYVFNALVTVRTYCGLSGTEYFDYWRHILEHPESTTKPYNDAITYSTAAGRPTPIQARQIVPEEVEQPLQPELIDGKRNKISGVAIWLWTETSDPKISAMRVDFENGDSYEMGWLSDNMHYLDFNGAYCTSLFASARKGVDYLVFTLSDGREVSYGTQGEDWEDYTEFQLENHHIAGIFLGYDLGGRKRQAANITVSYQLTPQE